jgi:hypothetical protein
LHRLAPQQEYPRSPTAGSTTLRLKLSPNNDVYPQSVSSLIQSYILVYASKGNVKTTQDKDIVDFSANGIGRCVCR